MPGPPKKILFFSKNLLTFVSFYGILVLVSEGNTTEFKQIKKLKKVLDKMNTLCYNRFINRKEETKMNLVEKDKNMIYFHWDKRNNPASLDINTGKFLSYSGGEVSHIPPYINVMLTSMERSKEYRNLGRVLFDIASHKAILRATDYAYRMKIADRLDSANITINYQWNDDCTDEWYKAIEDNFKELVKYASRHEGQKILIKEFLNNVAEQKILAELGLEELPTNFIAYMNDFRIHHKYARNLLGWYHRIYPYFEIQNNNDDWRAKRDFFNSLSKYYYYCEMLGEEPQKTNNFMQEFVRVAETYCINKEKIDNEAIMRNQSVHKEALSFENVNFVAVIPTTAEEFRNEANAQNNCVYRTYLAKVVKGATNIVFVRKKNDINHSYITCEVKNGRIVQFLARYNKKVSDELALQFEADYQQYLIEKW